ncbi:Dcp1p-Dcp2p decapping enzyme complex alpha subunit [Cladochytrium tenue]|nr:Dcp1p-Dcp2p decapping enzyme complex alpha subunit [Cladochytrium tenue]
MVPEIPGQPVEPRLQSQLQQIVARLFNARRGNDFLGCQPVSFGKRHLESLESEDYFVSEKADGVRCLLFTNLNNEKKPQSFLVQYGS